MEKFEEAPVFEPVGPGAQLASVHPTCNHALVENLFEDESEQD